MNKRIAGLSSALSITIVACVGAVSENGRSCPCAAGWLCCISEAVCVGPGVTCPVDDAGEDAASSGEGLDATPGDDAASPDGECRLAPPVDAGFIPWDGGPGDDLTGSCPDATGSASFTSISDATSVLPGRWLGCTGSLDYGEPQTNLVSSLGCPADTIGIEFAAATTGGGSCAAMAGGMPCAGGPAWFLVNGPTGLARGVGCAYQSSYAVFDNGSPYPQLALGANPTFDFWGRTSPPIQALSIETSGYSFLPLAAVSPGDAGTDSGQ